MIEPDRTETDKILIKQLEDRIRNLEEELKDERHANEVLEQLAEKWELKCRDSYNDGVIYGLKYTIVQALKGR
jgi:hypothetical protein